MVLRTKGQSERQANIKIKTKALPAYYCVGKEIGQMSRLDAQVMTCLASRGMDRVKWISHEKEKTGKRSKRGETQWSTAWSTKGWRMDLRWWKLITKWGMHGSFLKGDHAPRWVLCTPSRERTIASVLYVLGCWSRYRCTVHECGQCSIQHAALYALRIVAVDWRL